MGLPGLRRKLRHFVSQRDWDQYHSPKNLASALVVEAGELLEHFQWIDESASRTLTRKQLDPIRDEIADVFIYLVQLADKLDVDLLAAADRKIKKNARKYPAHKPNVLGGTK